MVSFLVCLQVVRRRPVIGTVNWQEQMRRKVIQDFANVCCQMFLTSMSNYDRINFVLFGSGTVVMDFTNQRCTHNNLAVSPLQYCIKYYGWLAAECIKYNVDIAAITTAELTAKMDISIQREKKGIHGWLSTTMGVECSSRLVFDTIEYTSKMKDYQESGLGQIICDHTY